MKKGIFFILLIVFLVFVNTNIVRSDAVPATATSTLSGSGWGGFFGGRIINTKALEIETLEASGFICFVPGSTISIIPIGSPPGTPINYFIPSFVTSKTGYGASTGALILGKYGGIMTISCTLPAEPPITTVVSLNIINLFGASAGFGTGGGASGAQ